MVFETITINSTLLKIILFPARFGEQAVYFFMMLSGFVLTNAYCTVGKLVKFKNWLVWRVCRLLPVYYVSLFTAILLTPKNLRWSDISHIYIVRNDYVYSGPNPPLWSLTVEIILSILLFPLIKNCGNIRVSILATFSIGLYMLSYAISSWGLKGLVRSAAIFILGIILYHNNFKIFDFRMNTKKIFICLSFLTILITPKLLNFILILPLLLLMDQFINNPLKLFVNRLTIKLGQYSFSLYATHWIVLTTISSYIHTSVLLTYFISILASFIFAIVFAHLVEFPARKFSRKLLVN